jgi:hypothetical protein
VKAVQNAWPQVNGGCISADAPNVVTSVAAITHPISMRRNITQKRVTQSSGVLNQARIGFTIMAQGTFLKALYFPILNRTP